MSFRQLLRSTTARIALALLLAVSQQQAVLHLVGHSLDSIAQSAANGVPGDSGDTAPHEQLCEKCLAFAHLDHALHVSVPVIPMLAVAPVETAATPYAIPALAPARAYRERAPPLNS